MLDKKTIIKKRNCITTKNKFNIVVTPEPILSNKNQHIKEEFKAIIGKKEVNLF